MISNKSGKKIASISLSQHAKTDADYENYSDDLSESDNLPFYVSHKTPEKYIMEPNSNPEFNVDITPFEDASTEDSLEEVV